MRPCNASLRQMGFPLGWDILQCRRCSIRDVRRNAAYSYQVKYCIDHRMYGLNSWVLSAGNGSSDDNHHRLAAKLNSMHKPRRIVKKVNSGY